MVCQISNPATAVFKVGQERWRSAGTDHDEERRMNELPEMRKSIPAVSAPAPLPRLPDCVN
jgi:hypothetical protein